MQGMWWNLQHVRDSLMRLLSLQVNQDSRGHDRLREGLERDRRADKLPIEQKDQVSDGGTKDRPWNT